jgi:50S ribosomal protein L16 3-hydroxylase
LFWGIKICKARYNPLKYALIGQTMTNPLKINFDTLNPKSFLKQFWQQKPLLIRRGFADFEDLISPDELAGLACEEMVESRLICYDNNQWHTESGPIDDYERLGDKNWSLVVQAADNWAQQVAELTEAFNFLPDWRRDDVMISFAVPGGSVGPHVDNYDTFICQGSGTRHWRVGDKGNLKQFSANEALLHVEPFEAIIDVILEPGDILYIPPGYPHEGVALEPSMSFSVGYRTMSAKDTLSALADHLIDHDLANGLLVDPNRPISSNPGLVDNTDLDLIKQHLLSVLQDDKLLARFSGCHLSQPKHTLDVPEAPFDYTEPDVKSIIMQQPLHRLGGLRCYYFEQTLCEGLFYINGEECQLDPQLVGSIKNLCNCAVLTADLIADGLADEAFLALLTTFICQGCWYFEE